MLTLYNLNIRILIELNNLFIPANGQSLKCYTVLITLISDGVLGKLKVRME